METSSERAAVLTTPGVRVLHTKGLAARAKLVHEKLPKLEDMVGEGYGDNVQMMEKDIERLKAQFGESAESSPRLACASAPHALHLISFARRLLSLSDQ